jgi:hypothetical protein
MAFHINQEPSKLLSDIANYEKYLKKDSDPALKAFQSPEGFYLNITRIEQTEEEKKVSEGMEKFYNNYRAILEEKKDE